MLTHKQVKNTNLRWKKNYGSEAFILIKARNKKDCIITGIHLLNPNREELAQAFCDAQQRNYKCIIIHTAKTFGLPY